MIRSRRFALAAVVVVLGLSACGDRNTTSPLADQPQVIQLASGQTGAASPAPAAESIDAAADSKMPFFGPTEFVYDGELPALDAPAGSWFYPTGAQPDLDRIAKLATALGVEGEVRALPVEQGGGWAVGPEDYSAAVLSVGSDGMLNWWLSAAPTTGVGVACAVSAGATEPVVGAGDAGSSGGTTDVPPPAYTDSEGDTPVAVDAPTETIAGDVVAPDCPTPEPPVGVPTKDEALATAKQLFADWGYDVNSYQFDDPYADEWGASVNASLLLDGMKAPIALSVGFGENGTVTYASGALAEPQRGDDYPTIGAAAGLERLKTQQNQYVGLGSPEARSAVDVAASDPASGAPAVAPDIAPCEPEAASADCAPVPNSEPVTVTLNSVKADLTMVWAADSTIWLLPAYSFGSADGGIYTVIAVEDAYIHQADPVPATGQTDPGIVPVPDTALPVPADGTTCATFERPTVVTEPGIDVSFGERWIGQCLSYAEAEASSIGFSVRVVRQDGVDLPITDDFSNTRFNVATKGDIVSEIISIG